MKYNEFVEHITLRHSGNVKYGLDRMISLLAEIGSPEQKLRGFHIAGTNGKGSTSAILEKISLSLGLRTGLNTSPHLLDYRERIRVDGRNIKKSEIMRIYKKFAEIFENNEASFFEITTAMAFYYFHEQKIDTSIFEVGLGGRLDGTNPFKSTVTAITSISIDHPKSLGNTIEKIAYEKAGIIKNKTPLILGKIPINAKNIIRGIALDKDSEVYEYDKDFFVEIISINDQGTIFNYSCPKLNIELRNLRINLLGAYQALNAATAITSFYVYLKKINSSFTFLKVENSIRNGLDQVVWPGRLQIMNKIPLVIIDGAHNEEGVEGLIKNIKSIFPEKKIRFVLAILRDKNIDKMIQDICSISSKVYISKNKSNRAAEISEQVDIAKKSKIPYKTAKDIISATKLALNEAGDNEIIVITGSLYTISEVLAHKADLF